MRSSRACRLALLVMAAVAAISCGGVPKTAYYTMRIPPPPRSQDPRTGAVLGIERLAAPDVLRDDRIVFYESPTQLNFYQYHRWSSDPATMVRDSIAERLNQTGVFAQVLLLPARQPVDYYLRGRLLNFEEVDYESGVQGRAALELALVRAQDRKVLWSDTRQAQSPAQGNGVAAVVDALNAAGDRVLSEMLPRLVTQVAQDIERAPKAFQ